MSKLTGFGLGADSRRRKLALTVPLADDWTLGGHLAFQRTTDLLVQGGKAAGKMAASSLPAYARSRQLLRASFETDLAQQLDLERTSMAEAAATPECGEGIAAFLERRKPDFRKAK